MRSPHGLHLCCGLDIAKRSISASDTFRTADALLNAGIDINQEAIREGQWKATPLWYAVAHGKNLALAEYLLSNGSDPNHCLWAAAYNYDPKQMTAQHYMLKKGSDKSHFRMMMKYGPSGDIPDSRSMTAADIMMRKRDPEFREMARTLMARN